MKNNAKVVLTIGRKIQRGAAFVGFTYKKENGEVSQRTVNFGVRIGPAQERRGTPVKGVGNWHKGKTEGKFGFAIRRDEKIYVRGYDMKDNKLKIFCADGITLH